MAAKVTKMCGKGHHLEKDKARQKPAQKKGRKTPRYQQAAVSLQKGGEYQRR